MGDGCRGPRYMGAKMVPNGQYFNSADISHTGFFCRAVRHTIPHSRCELKPAFVYSTSTPRDLELRPQKWAAKSK